nr:hypothetical protein KPHV_44970 [Kitasatospora purpeofusca]
MPLARIDLVVLVVDDDGPAVAALATELTGQGTPFRRVRLADPARPTIDAAFLSDTVDGRPRAKYQGVILPNENPFGAGSAEMAALAAFETSFGIRQIDTSTTARPAVGLGQPAYTGSLAGLQAGVTAVGLAGPFGYLKGGVPFDADTPAAPAGSGQLANPLGTLPAGASFTTLVDAPVPGGSGRGSLVGEYAHDGRRELVLTFTYRQEHSQFRLLARGLVDWVTQGVHVGFDRNYLSVEVDGVLEAGNRWSPTLKCTPGNPGCPAGTPPTAVPIRMTADDAAHLRQWQQVNGLTLDLAFSGGGSEDWKTRTGAATDPLADRLAADQAGHRFLNRTYRGQYLGCVQDTTVTPWRCRTDPAGNTVWVDQAAVQAAVQSNLTWAGQHGLTVNPAELVTPGHSGLTAAPQQPADNPNLGPALNSTGVKWIAADAGRESTQRPVGGALTVPRHSLGLFPDAGTSQEQTDQYNWLRTGTATGGSGSCGSAGQPGCLTTPLNPATGYATHIVPTEARSALGRILANDPRPQVLPQSALAEERIGYALLDRVLTDYRALHADSAPPVNLPAQEIGVELQRRAAFAKAVANGQVTAYRLGTVITLKAPSGVRTPVTAPASAVQRQPFGPVAFGSPYAGTRSGWVAPGALQTSAVLAYDTPESPLPPAPSVSTTSYPENAWSPRASGPVTFSFTSTASNLTNYLYAFDTPFVYGTLTTDPSLTLTPSAGWHLLKVAAVDVNGNRSPVTTYRFGVGTARLTAPAGGTTTDGTAVPLAAESQRGQFDVRFQYRPATGGTFGDIPAADVTGGGVPLTEWPVDTLKDAEEVSTGTSPNLTWNASHSLTADGDYQIRAVFEGIDGVPLTTEPVTVTLSRPGVMPGAPPTVTAVARDGAAAVSWTAPASTGASPLTGYTVTTTTGSGTVTGTPITVPAGTLATVVPGLVNGTPYTVTVAANNAQGTGPGRSASVTPAPAGPPGPVGALTVTRGNGQARVTWTAPTTDGGSPLADTTVEIRRSADGTLVGSRSAATGQTSVTVTQLPWGVPLYARVSARNAAGAAGPAVDSAPFTLAQPLTLTGMGVWRTSDPATGVPMTCVLWQFTGALTDTLSGTIHYQRTAVGGGQPDPTSDWGIDYAAATSYSGADGLYSWCVDTVYLPSLAAGHQWSPVSLTATDGQGTTLTTDASALAALSIVDPDGRTAVPVIGPAQALSKPLAGGPAATGAGSVPAVPVEARIWHLIGLNPVRFA